MIEGTFTTTAKRVLFEERMQSSETANNLLSKSGYNETLKQNAFFSEESSIFEGWVSIITAMRILLESVRSVIV